MSRDLGADDRVVAVIQYLRVILAVALTPLVAVQAYHAEATGVAGDGGAASSWLGGVLFVAVCGVAGLGLARRLRVPGAELLWPMVVAVVLALTCGWHLTTPPSGVVDAAFAVIGLDVGLRLTPAVLRRLGRVLPAAIGLILLMIACSAVLGWLLAAMADVTAIDGFLAMTPGGLPAVVAVAVDDHADLTFILAVQVLRTVLMLLAAAPIARWIGARSAA
jgi:membrane AbrB-like protein